VGLAPKALDRNTAWPWCATLPGMKLYPSLRYKDAKAAHQWLQEAFGFQPVALYEDDRGGVAHAEMRWGSDLIMFGTAREDRYGERVGQGWVYATCEDPDALYARAVAAGAEVTMELTDQEYGSRDFGVRDLEGNHWSFGTYEPT
jgi:uncharacterized glyoxalase superfamily protein PhnB